MPRRHIHVTAAADTPLRAALRAMRTKLALPDTFPPAVLAEAEAAAKAPHLPEYDATDIPFFTIDPPTSKDLDQAMHLARRADGGYRVHYAIADVGAFVAPGGAIDAEAHKRATTVYLPDGKVPLHPAVLSEGAASLLPGNTAPALLWRIDLDAEGRTVATDVRRALVRSLTKLSYASAQAQIDAGTAEEPLALLPHVGRLREALEIERGGVSLAVPEQEVVEAGGSYTLEYRAPLRVDGWNEQISLLTGMAAADLMTAAGTGILRTLPPAPDGSVARLRHSAKALGIDWPHHMSYAELIRSLDPGNSRHAAFLQDATSLLQGSAYTPFTGGHVPEHAVHAAIADEYTHCTAPLRRLVDRYTGELCLAAVAGTAPPEWVLRAMDKLNAEMGAGMKLARKAERMSVDIVEAAVMSNRIGETFDSVLIDKEVVPHLGLVGIAHLEEPAVIGVVVPDGAELPLGEHLRVRLTQADPGRKVVQFVPA
ncbi:RNB domain-containing ribonuclease [Streptomyces sp. NPDC085481]|uniref:RNB domain-containing ribonuclease n=1 Tax=Streptomyces sp. NPDC085481 TaxID=3365727 RepID=UPI0037D50980